MWRSKMGLGRVFILLFQIRMNYYYFCVSLIVPYASRSLYAKMNKVTEAIGRWCIELAHTRRLKGLFACGLLLVYTQVSFKEKSLLFCISTSTLNGTILLIFLSWMAFLFSVTILGETLLLLEPLWNKLLQLALEVICLWPLN